MDWIDGDYQASTPEWHQKLDVHWTRVSCRVTIRNTPAKCVNYVQVNPTPEINRYFLYVKPDSTTILADALQFSAEAAAVPAVESVGVDDFFDAYATWAKQMPNAAQFVNQMLDNLKSADPHLKFGITLYEDELDPSRNPLIAGLSAEVRARFDYIHLFLHYRANSPRFADYVVQAQAAFPNAKIIAGVYSYDRIDYFPCVQGDRTKRPCSTQEELSYFKQALDSQVRLLRDGKVIALELFPGYFGSEANLYGPGRDSVHLNCKDTARCIQNTIAMRDMVLAAHDQFVRHP